MQPQVLKVLSLSTESNLGSDNFENTLNHFGYHYQMLGRGETFQGWKWRTEVYYNTIKATHTSDDDIFVICDANDLYFVAPPDVLIHKYLAVNHPVVIGAEAACCNGYYMNESVRHIAWDGTKKVVNSRYRFPNGGYVMGRAGALLALLKANMSEYDDQGGYLQKMIDDYGKYFVIDSNQNIVGNVSNIHGTYWIPGDDATKPEGERWAIDTSSGKVINNVTGGTPAVLHFPGSNWPEYNRMALAVFPGYTMPSEESKNKNGRVSIHLSSNPIRVLLRDVPLVAETKILQHHGNVQDDDKIQKKARRQLILGIVFGAIFILTNVAGVLTLMCKQNVKKSYFMHK